MEVLEELVDQVSRALYPTKSAAGMEDEGLGGGGRLRSQISDCFT